MPSNPHKRTNEESNHGRAKRAKLTAPTEVATIQTDAETDFPRGGATKSVLVPEVAPKRNKNLTGHDDSRPSSRAKPSENSPVQRVEHLNYKRVVPGMRLLVRIVALRSLCVIVSLPNQLLGHIPITQISLKYTSMLEAASENSTQQDDEDGEAPELSRILSPGQFLPVTVIAVHPQGSKVRDHLFARDELLRASQRVELSAMPSLVNGVLSSDNLPEGSVLLGSVHSVEDHGYLMDLGLPGIDGFLPFVNAEHPSYADSAIRLQEGAVSMVVVKGRNDGGRTYQLSSAERDLRQCVLQSSISADSITPGSLIQALVSETSSSGVVLQLFGSFECTGDIFHTPVGSIKPGSKVQARIMYCVPNSSPPKFVVSLAPHLLSLSPHVALVEQYPIGTFVNQSRVSAVLPEWGVIVQLYNNKDVGFVHISQLSDDHVTSLSATTGPYRVGSSHEARVTGHHSLDQVLQLSFKKSTLERRFLQVSELQPGDTLVGRVKSVTEKGVFVALSGNVDGVIWPSHYADIMLRHPRKRFKEGSSLKCKVLVVEPNANRVVLTAKKSLVDSSRPILHCLSDVRVGLITDAVVNKVSERGLIVEFYNNLKAFIPRNELTDSGDTVDLPIGRPVIVMIIGIDSKNQRVTASILRVRETPHENAKAPIVGHTVIGFVAEIQAEQALLLLQPSQLPACIKFNALASQRQVIVAKLKTALSRGEEIRDLTVVSCDGGVLAVVPVSSSDRPIPAIAPEKIDKGAEVMGRVIASGPKSAVVRITKTITGVLHVTDCADDYSRCTGPPPVQTTLKAVVVGHDTPSNLHLSIRPSRVLGPSEPVVDPEITALDQLSVGQAIRGFVQNIATHGLFVAIGCELVARIQIRELFDEYIQDWQSKFHVGAVVSGRIKSVDPSRGLIELTLRSPKASRSNPSTSDGTNLKVGQIVKGRVKRKEKYGIFIEVAETTISGLCHKSEVSDSPDYEASIAAYNDGDSVKAIILSIDPGRNRISFGLKPSYLNGDDTTIGPSSGTYDERPSEPEEFSRVDDSSSLPADDGDSQSEPERSSLNVGTGFDWGGTLPKTKDKIGQLSEKLQDDVPRGVREKRAKDRVEVDHTLDLHTGGLQSSSDFERVLLGSPNSSYAWIRYASFYIQLSDIARARDVLRRALKSIHFREEAERFNIWMSLLNLECTFSDDDSVESVFQEAVRANDPKTVHLRLASIYQQAGQSKKASDYYQKVIHKFARSSKAWTQYAAYLFEERDLEGARHLLPQSLNRLEKRKHVKTIAKFAQFEFKFGDPERGRTIFEGLLESYPRRMDLWFILVDMEVKVGDLPRVRAIFIRIMGMHLSAHRAKSAFKKWLAVEKQLGDEESIEAVKQRAQEWRTANSIGNMEGKIDDNTYPTLL